MSHCHTSRVNKCCICHRLMSDSFLKKRKLEACTSAHIMQVLDNYRSKEMLQSQSNVSGYECNKVVPIMGMLLHNYFMKHLKPVQWHGVITQQVTS